MTFFDCDRFHAQKSVFFLLIGDRNKFLSIMEGGKIVTKNTTLIVYSEYTCILHMSIFPQSQFTSAQFLSTNFGCQRPHQTLAE